MRRDGEATFYRVQGVLAVNPKRPCWSNIDAGEVLFSGLTYDERRGALGEHYRSLLKPQQASSALWQRYGITGFAEQDDAAALVAALREKNPDKQYRVVRRTITQRTEVVC